MLGPAVPPLSGLRSAFTLDCSGQLCPVPILMTEEKLADLGFGEILEVVFTDPGARPDLLAWCKGTGQECLGFRDEKAKSFAYIKKVKA